MDNNNWRPAQTGGDPVMDPGDWRNQLQPDSRQKIVNKIMETLKRHLPFSGSEGINELSRIAARFEEKIYASATNQTDYLRKISMKMLTMENRSQNNVGGSSPSLPAANNNKPLDSASASIQPQVQTQGQSMQSNQSQISQQLLSQNMQTNIGSGAQGSAALSSSMPPVSGLSNANISGILSQNSNMQNVSGMLQDTSVSSMGPGAKSNMSANSQRRPQSMASQQPQSGQYNYQQQLQQQLLLKQNYQQGNLPSSLMSSHMQQQQQQNVLQPSQLHLSQQAGIPTSSVMQLSGVNSAPLSGLQQSQQLPVQQPTQSMLRQHPQSVLRQHQQSQQASGGQQQQTSLPHQSNSQIQQQQQQLLWQQGANSGSIQQNQLVGGDTQQQHHNNQQRLLSQQNALPNIQQQQQQQQATQKQQPLMTQQNNLQSIHQQQLVPQTNTMGSQQQPQQQLLGNQVGNPGMTNQQSVHMLSQSKVNLHQRQNQLGSSLLAGQGQQSQPQPSQQQMLSQMQSQSSQLPQQQQLGLQQQSNLLQHDMQQRLQASGSLIQPQNVLDQQKQLYQSHRALPEMPSSSLDSTAQTGNANGGDWQEEVYQKIKTMKEMYLPDLNEIYQRVAARLQQHDSLPQQQKSEQVDKLKLFKTMLERMITFLSVSKSNISPPLKEKLGYYEKQIISFLNSNRPRRSPQQGQLPLSQMQSMQQPQSQITQGLPHDIQANSQSQQINTQGSMQRTHQSGVTSLPHNSLSSLSGVSAAQQNISNAIPSSSLESGQGNALHTTQQTMQHSSSSLAQQVNNNSTITSQSGANQLQPTLNPGHANSSLLQHQHQHLKQQQEQQMTQQLKQQLQQRQMQQQLMQKQQLLHQQQQQQLQARQHMSQLHQMTDVNDLRLQQGMNVKPGMFQQHLAQNQRSSYSLQQLKPGTQLPASSPQLLQSGSPQIGQHPSPQVDQKNLISSSINKSGTPMQSATSPFVVPSPSTPLAPSPLPVVSEKPISGTSSLSNAVHVGRQQTTGGGQALAQSLAIGTPGISASPLLQEFSVPDGNNIHPTMTAPGKSSLTEQPLDRLIKAVSSISSKALCASVSDIASVVTMVDRIAGSAPGNGSRASVGEDLVAMTKCRLQARNFITQDGGIVGTRKMKRNMTAMPLSVASSTGSISDNFKQLAGTETSELESTATSSNKKPRVEINHALVAEIRQINQRLIDTVAEISEENMHQSSRTAPGGSEGTIIKCSFTAVSLSPSLKSQFSSTRMSPVQPLRLLVPPSYPRCSPVLLDKFPLETSKENEDLTLKTRSRCSTSLRSLSQPLSLRDIVRTWDASARAVVSEYAQQHGGDTFSSKYGTWDNCLTAP